MYPILTQRLRTTVVALALTAVLLAPALTASAADVTLRVDENPEQGWAFNAEPPWIVPAADFSTDEHSIGDGSLHAPPIVNDVNARKLILRYVPGDPLSVADLDSFWIDFLIDDEGTSFAANQFYLNLYTRRTTASANEWYSCRYDYVAAAGSIVSWTALGFATSDAPTNVVKNGNNPEACAATPDGENDHDFLFLSVNMGDTSANDEGIGGYFDNARLTLDGMTTTFDFEAFAAPFVTDVAAAPNPVGVEEAVELTALAEDTGPGATTIASAAYTIDGGGGAMSAVDGAFDEAEEALEAGFAAPEESGIYALCVTATNGGGIQSEPVCTDLIVYDPDGGFVTGGGWIDSPAGAGLATTLVWDQDFETGTEGWLDSDDAWFGDITASGGTAIVTESGGSAPFSRFDGYRDTWAGDWTAEIDVYLDPDWVTGSGFDYSVAANGSNNAHQRDYIFHVGVVEDYGPISVKSLLVNGSNNADFTTNRYKLVNDNGGNYHEVTSAGWYTLQHAFRDDGGSLAVDLNLLDAGGSILWTATRENVADTIPAEVGGNRYSWFTHVEVPGGLEIDDHQLWMPVATPEGRANFGFVSKYKKGASIPTGATQFTFQAGDIDFHSNQQDWLVVTGNDQAKFKGTGTVNGEGAYKFMIWAGDGAESGDPDTFRIKIWSEDGGVETVLYDNGSNQAIGGGQIIVHTGKGKP